MWVCDMCGEGVSATHKTTHTRPRPQTPPTSASVSAICPRAPRPKLYERSGLPHSEESGVGGRGSRSKTVMLL